MKNKYILIIFFIILWLPWIWLWIFIHDIFCWIFQGSNICIREYDFTWSQFLFFHIWSVILWWLTHYILKRPSSNISNNILYYIIYWTILLWFVWQPLFYSTFITSIIIWGLNLLWWNINLFLTIENYKIVFILSEIIIFAIFIYFTANKYFYQKKKSKT